MRRCITFIVATVVLLGHAVWAGGLDSPGDVDIVRIRAADGQLFLIIVLDEPVATPMALSKLRKKLEAYAWYAKSGQAYRNDPQANPTLPARYVVITVGNHSEHELKNIAILQQDLAESGQKFEVVPYGKLKEHLSSQP
jgi:hypothetical protein